jgi:hypothetical protein
MKYDYQTLTDFCEEHNVVLCEDYSLKTKINAFTIIEGNCINNCGNTFKKEFRSFAKTVGYCSECTKNNAKQKLKTSWLNKYGVEHISKLDYIKDKVKKTSLERYGVECSLQNNAVNEKTKNTCLEKYGTINYLHCKEIQDKIKKNNLEKYGVEHYSQSQECKERYKLTSLEKYGTEHYSQTEEFKERIKSTCLEKYGVESYSKTDAFKNTLKETLTTKYGFDSPFKIKEFVDKGKKMCLKKYGSEYYSKTEEFKEKTKATCLKKYGVEHASQNSDIAEKQSKSAYKSREYIFPSGRIEKIQGYENFMLDELLQNNVPEDDIIVSRKYVPEIWFNKLNGKRSRYFVDCFIKSENKCIEIKSDWTVKEEDVFLKQKAVKDAGYKCEIWVYNRKGIKIEKYE